MNELGKTKAPWHLWVLAILGLLWFAGGANDYVQTQMRNQDYLGMMAESVDVPLQTILDYYGDFPVWADAMWAIGVWGSVLGAILLLARSRFAFHSFIASIIGLIGTTIYTMTADMPAALNTTFSLIFTIVIWITVIGFAFYARRMTAAGVLK